MGNPRVMQIMAMLAILLHTAANGCWLPKNLPMLDTRPMLPDIDSKNLSTPTIRLMMRGICSAEGTVQSQRTITLATETSTTSGSVTGMDTATCCNIRLLMEIMFGLVTRSWLQSIPRSTATTMDICLSRQYTSIMLTSTNSLDFISFLFLCIYTNK